MEFMIENQFKDDLCAIIRFLVVEELQQKEIDARLELYGDYSSFRRTVVD